MLQRCFCSRVLHCRRKILILSSDWNNREPVLWTRSFPANMICEFPFVVVELKTECAFSDAPQWMKDLTDASKSPLKDTDGKFSKYGTGVALMFYGAVKDLVELPQPMLEVMAFLSTSACCVDDIACRCTPFAVSRSASFSSAQVACSRNLPLAASKMTSEISLRWPRHLRPLLGRPPARATANVSAAAGMWSCKTSTVDPGTRSSTCHNFCLLLLAAALVLPFSVDPCHRMSPACPSANSMFCIAGF